MDMPVQRSTDLMAGEDQSIGDHDVLAAAGSEYNDFGDVVGCEGLAASANVVSFGLNPVKR